MALYRTIQLSFWTDAKVVDDFTPEDRYFYLYLMTNPHTTLCGCYEVSIRQIAAETGYSKDVVERLIDRMEKVHDVVRYDKTTKEILILNWHKYNWTKSPKLRPAIESSIDKVKTTDFINYLHNLLDGIDTVSIPYEYGSDTSVTVTDIENVDISSDVNIKRNTKNKKNKNDIHDSYSTERHRYGEYGHVLLTDKQYDKLVADYGEDKLKLAIQNVDEYCQQHGKRYQDYNLTIRKWGFDYEKKSPVRKTREQEQSSLDEWAARKDGGNK